MQLIPAPGSQEMRDAIGHIYVRRIVDILLQVIGQDYFRLVALFLKDHDQRTSPAFARKLQALRSYYERRSNAEGGYLIPPYIDELISTLEALYGQDQEIVGFQRGAIVELLTNKLVSSRCRSGECQNNHRFVDGRYISDQVDVAVLSDLRQQIEGYACKIKPIGIMSVDCSNLITLAHKANEVDYDARVGFICFDNSHAIRQRVKDRLQDFLMAPPIASYGIDNFQDLRKSPF